MRRFTALCFAALMVGQNITSAIFVAPSDAPVDRLITNAAAYIQENPQDPQGYYTLARIHYLAFANMSSQVPVFDSRNGRFPEVAPDWLLRYLTDQRRRLQATRHVLKELGYASQAEVPSDERQEMRDKIAEKVQELEGQGSRSPGPSGQELNQHAASASENFERAIELDPNNALYYLGLASLLEQYTGFVKAIYGIPEAFSGILLEKAKETYYKAYTLSIEADIQLESLPAAGLHSLVSHEAGQAYLRLSDPESAMSPDEKTRVEAVQSNLGRLGSLRRGMITPIVFSLSRHTALPDLLAPEIRARFDLDGDGLIETWTWVRPETGILVWDPEQAGRITSGRQFFGSVTWWLFFANGYRALDSLDDNRDGLLAGEELAGISVWFDRNSNAQADEGEVIPVEELGVVSLAARSAGFDGDSPMNATGLELRDGRVVPTYDWIASPIPANGQSLGTQ
ncbi:MAG: hypothetical protein JW993_00165 [Sedimentisphaerales bacterium]|nr:hypothetical protein [Sedimentisphaerales bacterium]